MYAMSWERRFWRIGAAAVAIGVAAFGCEQEPAPYPPPSPCTGPGCQSNIHVSSPGQGGGSGQGGSGGSVSNTCNAPFTECPSEAGLVCVDLTSDSNNCGECNVVCDPGMVCMTNMCM